MANAARFVTALQDRMGSLFSAFSIFAGPVFQLNPRVQLELFQKTRSKASGSSEDWLLIAGRRLALRLVRNPRAYRYILRVDRQGIPQVTIPRGGSQIEAKRFVQKHSGWLEKQLLRQAKATKAAQTWQMGSEIQFRGQAVTLQAGGSPECPAVRFGSEVVRIPEGAVDLRGSIERHLWRLAAMEFPPRVFELAAKHGLTVKRVTVRNQRSRWGSCSRHGTISLNWRLIQAPEFVRDYIILHELAHLRQMNHSRRFWREVERLCPDFKIAESWLKRHSREFGL